MLMLALTISVALPLAKLDETAIVFLIRVDGPKRSHHFPRKQVRQSHGRSNGSLLQSSYLVKVKFGN